MADEFKVTRIEIQRGKGSIGNPNHVICYFVDTTTVPPTPGNVAVDTTDAIVENPVVLQGTIDTQLALFTAATIDWDK